MDIDDTVWFQTNIYNYKCHFYSEIVTGKIFSKKEEFILSICRFGESFWLSASGFCKVGFEEIRHIRVVGLDCMVNLQECSKS